MLEIVLRTIVIKKRARIYTTIVQIIVKDDRGKAIAWRSVSCKVTCYHVSDKKTIRILSPHFVPSLQSAVCVLYLVCILYPVCSLQSAVCFWTDRIGIAVSVRSSLKSRPKYWSWMYLVVCWGAPEEKQTTEQWLLYNNRRRTQIRGLLMMLFRVITACVLHHNT